MAYNHDYGVPLHDCIDVWQWMLSNASTYGLDMSRAGAIGDSAGGFLAVKTALYCIENGVAIPSSMMLVYPVIDCSMRTPSMKEYTDTPVWNNVLNAQMWRYYLNNNEETSLLDLPHSLLAQLPATYIETAQYDCLRDEGATFARMLQDAGTATTYTATERTMHGFDMAHNSHITQQQIAQRCEWIINNITR